MNQPNTPDTGLISSLKATWALLLGFGILMLGDGLQGTLLAVRADIEGFSATRTGFIMSAFYCGFLSGSILTPRIMVRVGHIRVFAALASLASAAILVHAVFVQVPTWVALRLVSGFCFAGLYVVAESWLNDRATNANRGQLLSLYMVVTYLGVGMGQLLLNLAAPQDYPLFVLTSVLISVAVIPLLLSAGEAPRYSESVAIRLRDLYRLSPLGVVGMFIEGLTSATFFALAPLYGHRLGLSLEEISYLMASGVIGVIILQWPIGALSDRFDRRRVLMLMSLLAAAAAYGCIAFPGDSTLLLFVSTGLFAGLTLPLYSVCIAHTNDHLEPRQMIAASGSLVLVGGIGAVIGPVMVAASMDLFGNAAFFWCMSGAHAATCIFALYRMTRRTALPPDRQGPITPAGMHPSSSVIESIQQYAVEESDPD